MSYLPNDPDARNEYPLYEGLFAYFPAALAEVSRVSLIGNRQHNGDSPLHWDRSKSKNHADKALRHLLDAGTKDSDGTLHTAKACWRLLAMLQEELERAGAPIARNAKRDWRDEERPSATDGPM